MAEGTIDSELFFLINKWGSPDHAFANSIPIGDGKWDGADGQNVILASISHKPGTIIRHYHRGQIEGESVGQSGFYEMTYLRAEAAVIAAKDICVASETDDHYAVESNPNSLLDATNFLIGVAIGVMTAQYYGWFWTGGVCPENDITATMGGNYLTNSSVAIGPIDVIDGDATDLFVFGPTTQEACGFSYSADS